MSEPANVQRIRALFDALGKGDFPAVLDLMAEDVEWRIAGPTQFTYAGIRRGRDKVAEFFKAMGDASEFEAFAPHEYIAQGEKVVVLGHERQRIRATGLTVENDWAMVFTVVDGKITRYRNYVDTAATVDTDAHP